MFTMVLEDVVWIVGTIIGFSPLGIEFTEQAIAVFVGVLLPSTRDEMRRMPLLISSQFAMAITNPNSDGSITISMG